MKNRWKWIRISLFILFACLITALAYQVGYDSAKTDQPVPTPTPATQPVDKLEPSDIDTNQLFALVNDERAKVGIQPLTLNTALNASAAEKCNDMVARNYWSHNTPDGQEPFVVIEKHYGQYRQLEENLGYGFKDAQSTVYGWMNSPGHKRNILERNVTEVGYAICYSPNYISQGENLIVVQHFASR